MTWSFKATGTEVSSRRRVTLVLTELDPGEYGVTEPLGCLDTWYLVRVKFLPYRCPSLFRLSEPMEKKSKEQIW